MSQTATSDLASTLLRDILTAEATRLSAKCNELMLASFDLNLRDVAAVALMHVERTQADRLRSTIERILDEDERDLVKGRVLREWLIKRGEIHDYASTIGNCGAPFKKLPLTLRCEFEIERLRQINPELPAHRRVGSSRNEQIRRGNLLAALQNEISAEADELAADRIELMARAAREIAGE